MFFGFFINSKISECVIILYYSMFDPTVQKLDNGFGEGYEQHTLNCDLWNQKR